MSANHSTAIGMLGWTDALPARVLPQNSFLRLSGLGFAATALFRIREFLAAFKDRRPKPPAGGGSEEPAEEPPRDTLWDDPALWMLMLH
jgi:hypothetical protein